MPTPADVAVSRYDCPQCRHPKGARCVTSSGAATAPHARRFGRGEGWLDAQTAVTPTPVPPQPGTPPPPAPAPLSKRPTQPAGIFYSGTPSSAWANLGALVIADQGNVGADGFKAVSAAGGTVLAYFDAVISNGAGGVGKYHQLLYKASAHGPAVPNWPGIGKASEWGYLPDFRPGGVLLGKLEAVLEQYVTENPHIGGFFADDLGSRSWFPLLNWSAFPDKAAYRNGAVEIARVFRRVADRHGLIVLVNGTWEAGAPDVAGGGYPVAAQQGCSLADGGTMELPDSSTWESWKAKLSGSQWASEARCKGTPMHLGILATAAERTSWAGFDRLAYVAQQTDYSAAAAPWGSAHPSGLPSRSV